MLLLRCYYYSTHDEYKKTLAARDHDLPCRSHIYLFVLFFFVSLSLFPSFGCCLHTVSNGTSDTHTISDTVWVCESGRAHASRFKMIEPHILDSPNINEYKEGNGATIYDQCAIQTKLQQQICAAHIRTNDLYRWMDECATMLITLFSSRASGRMWAQYSTSIISLDISRE